jgi:hypothetical protein
VATPANTFSGSDQLQRSVWVVVDPKDFVTGSRIAEPLRVAIKDVTATPIAARSGMYCFTDLNLPVAVYTVQVQPLTRLHYLDAETTFTLELIPVPGQSLRRNPVAVQLMPRPDYPFDAQSTLARGRLLQTSDSAPIAGANIFLIVDAADKGLRGQTDERGEFAVLFPTVTFAVGDPASAKPREFKFQLRFKLLDNREHLTAEETVTEFTTKSMNDTKFPGT